MDRHTSWLSYSSTWLLTCLGAWTLQDWATLIGVALALGTYLITVTTNGAKTTADKSFITSSANS